jgi:hypothetical protein
MVRHFQKSGFPKLVMMGDKMLVLLGAPGFSINQAPDTRNPSPVRTHAEIHYAEVNFYCVK